MLQFSKARWPVAAGATTSLCIQASVLSGFACMLVLMLAAGVESAAAQTTPQDGIYQNLLQRQQQEQDLQNQLNGSLAVPQLPSAQLPPAQLPPADMQSQQLYDSQQQRQLEQQTQNQFLPAPMREEQNQTQMLQFQREDQAQQLEQQIRRNSSGVLPSLH